MQTKFLSSRPNCKFYVKFSAQQKQKKNESNYKKRNHTLNNNRRLRNFFVVTYTGYKVKGQ